MGRRIVPISLPQPAIIGLLNFFLKNHHIQFKKIITYKIKWMNEHTTKCKNKYYFRCYLVAAWFSHTLLTTLLFALSRSNLFCVYK
jgi:hypothetical protein